MRIVFSQYILINKNDLNFLDGSNNITDDIEEAFRFDSFDDAKSERICCDFPEDWDIRKVFTSYEIKETVE